MGLGPLPRSWWIPRKVWSRGEQLMEGWPTWDVFCGERLDWLRLDAKDEEGGEDSRRVPRVWGSLVAPLSDGKQLVQCEYQGCWFGLVKLEKPPKWAFRGSMWHLENDWGEK